MATISDVYEILSKASTAGIDKATAAVTKHGNAIARAGQQAAQASSSGFARAANGIKRLGSFALNVARGALSKLWGALKGIATLGAGILGGALLAIRDGFGRIGDTVGGVTDKIKDLAGKGVTAVKSAAKEVAKFVKDAGGFFGAIGRVGAGFVQRARQVVKAPIAIFKGVVKGAKAAGKALGAVALAAGIAGAAIAGAFLGEVAAASPRAAAALDRMSQSFGKAKTAFFAAFGETVAPLLEKVATLMEDPRFIEFATMLGTKIGGAVLEIANLFQTKTIPNTIALIAATKRLATVLRVLLGKALTTLGKLAKKTWTALRVGLSKAARAIAKGISGLSARVSSVLTGLSETVGRIFGALVNIVSAFWGEIRTAIFGNAKEASESSGAKIFDLAETAAAAFQTLKDVAVAAWGGIRNVIIFTATVAQKVASVAFGAIGSAMDTLIKILEDPRLIKFAKTMGKLIGGAIVKTAKFITKILIPSTVKLIKAVAALSNFITKSLLKAFKVVLTGASKLFNSAKAKLTEFAASAKSIFDGIKSGISDVWAGIQSIISGAINGAKWAVENAVAAIAGAINSLTLKLKTPWQGMLVFITGIWDAVKGVIADGINSVIDIMNGLIEGYNKTLAKLPGASKLSPIPPVSLAEGGIVKSPLLAVVGDSPRSPEVVAPLDKLAGMLKEITGGGLGGMVVNINVGVAPGGFATPELAGQGVADSFVQALRSRGVKLRT